MPGAGHRPPLKYVLANWKMYPTVDEARSLLLAIQDGLRERRRSDPAFPRVIVCPPFVAIPALRSLLDEEVVGLGAQTCHWQLDGPHTGEVSPRMLQGLVEYVMVGHSERRATGETDEQVARKVAAVADNGLIPILFVGEDEPDEGALGETEQRLRRGLAEVDVASHEVLVVYEPAWAIGAEEAASASHVRRAVGHLKTVLAELDARQRHVLYGGTVNETNIDRLVAVEGLDGVGATRGSLDANAFLRMVDRIVDGRGTSAD